MTESLVVLVDGVPTIGGVSVTEMTEKQIEAATLVHAAKSLLEEPAPAGLTVHGITITPETTQTEIDAARERWDAVHDEAPEAEAPAEETVTEPVSEITPSEDRDGVPVARLFGASQTVGMTGVAHDRAEAVADETVTTARVSDISEVAREKKPRYAQQVWVTGVVTIGILAVVAVIVASNPTPGPVARDRIITYNLAPCAATTQGGRTSLYNCQGSVTVDISRPLPIAGVLVVMDFPDSGHGFIGAVAKPVGWTGTVSVPITNANERPCVAGTYRPALNVYSGTPSKAKTLIQSGVIVTRTCP